MSVFLSKKQWLITICLGHAFRNVAGVRGGVRLHKSGGNDDDGGNDTGGGSGACPPRSAIPPPPKTPLQYNGVSWPEYCFSDQKSEHLFVLGDWGGLHQGGGMVKPAKNTNWMRGRWFKSGIDDKSQKLVARQMRKRARKVKPRLVLNGGDNFYWGGIVGECGTKSMAQYVKDFSDPLNSATVQFGAVFENMYKGKALRDVPWLLCFGNHDYGGYSFNTAWDQQIAYTWSHTKRWILPAQYWHQHLEYPTLKTSMDIYMIDTNQQDTTDPEEDPGHNICSEEHNNESNCEPFGPINASDCVEWFDKLWKDQVKWMEEKICASTADWQIIVTHFPPEPFKHQPHVVWDWFKLGHKCGIDFFVGSHRHAQEMHPDGGMAQIPYVVAGGGGGVTSEKKPGNNTMYGFFDMTITKESLFIESFNQYGYNKGSMTVRQRQSEKQRVAAGSFIETSEGDAFGSFVQHEFFTDLDSDIGTTNDGMFLEMDEAESNEESGDQWKS